MLRLGWDRGVVVMAALVGLAGGGCYDWASVRPTELPKLNAGASELEKADGSRFQVKRPVTANVMTPWGAKKFHQPVSSIEGETLTIAGDDVPELQIPLDQISSVRVGQLNAIDTTASVLVLAGVVVGTVLLYLWIRPDPNSHGVE